MIINKKNSSQPFYVSFIEKNGSSYNFVVNVGEINNLILQNYKFGLKNISVIDASLGELPVDGYPFTAQGDKGVIKKFGKDWVETFSTTESCSVYLTIPKIPPGYNFVGSDYTSKTSFWFNSENDFINAFHIDISTSPGFDERLEKNKKYIENFDKYQYDNIINSLNFYRPREFTNKEEYYGKIYIRIADIEIVNGIVKITQFLKSNIINPSRYIRMGCTNFNSTKFFVSYTAKSSDPILSTVWERDTPIDCPEMFLLNISEMKKLALNIFSNFLSSFYSKYDKDFLYNFPELTPHNPEETEQKITDLSIYRILMLYKNKSGSKFVFEKIYETEVNIREEDVPEEQRDLLEPLSEEDALGILGLEEDQDFVELINF